MSNVPEMQSVEILLVEDNPADVRLTREALKQSKLLNQLNGREVLKEIKKSPDLKRIPVAVLTTSRDEADILRSYNLHANRYITKPLDLDQFNRVVRSIEHFWFTIVTLPPGVE